MSSTSNLNRKIKTVVSPFHEMLCSLHVLAQPEHHPRRLAWARDVLRNLPSLLKEEIESVGKRSDAWTAFIDLADWGGQPMSCADGIAELAALPDAELVHLALNGKASIGMVMQWMNGARGIGDSEIEEAGMELLESAGDFRRRLTDTLAQYLDSSFRREWNYVEPLLHSAAADFQKQADRYPEQALGSLHPRLKVEKRTITAQKANTYLFDCDSLEHIYVFPSTFIAPHLLLGWSGNDLFLPLAVDIPELPYSDAPPADLLLRFKALGDETRLRIMGMLWRAPFCTKQLAPLLGISEAAVSKHLKLLSEAGLVRQKRRGSYQFYSADKEELEMLQVHQRQYFEQ